jgi:3-isopropylmalate dehydratase small subunit
MDINKNISGRVWLLGDHVNTDLIHPPSCFSLDETKIKNGLRVGMERLDRKVSLDDTWDDLVIVAGENFGCGSSRETSVRALFASGVRAIVAKSFARIFYRSLVNRGIAPLVCMEIQDKVADGDPIQIFIDEHHIISSNNEHAPFVPFDPHIKKILECGGLISYLKREQE